MKYILKFIIIPFTFFFTNLLAQNNIIDVIDLITKEYSYKSVKGVDLIIDPLDFIVFQKDGSFSYQVGDLDASGDWFVQKSINSDYVLKLNYSIPKDTIRFFQMHNISNNNLVLIEGDKIFELSHGFSNKVNVFSDKINNSFEPIVQAIGSVIFFDLAKILGLQKNIPFIVVWLIFGAVFFTLKMKFINFKGFKHAISLVKGDYDDPNNKGEVSHFQALTTALSGTVGLGNIAGVAIAISLGGAGATFWMIVAGLLGMSSKFVECTLGVKYRYINSEGVVYGGPMYYLRDGLAKRNLKNLGKFLAVLFAVLCVGGSIGGGNMFQANQAFSAIKGIFPSLSNLGPVFGLVFALLVGFVIIGGI